ncbi:hypothetical protein ACH5RR_030391 [Cinchona calisaya]|uniref:Uncharacterized protein n=1 Tax=Cinchona calisaya TaxID=153742 RepID=A0ABD2YXZ1_9GENT
MKSESAAWQKYLKENIVMNLISHFFLLQLAYSRLVRMAGASVTILCYWNGRMTTGLNGLFYEGVTPKAKKVSCRIKYNELMEKIYGIISFERQLVNIKIICRYPSTYKEYIPLPIEDRDTLNIVFDAAKRPGIHCLEFYLEAISRSDDEQGHPPSVFDTGPITELVTQEGTLVDDFQTNCDIVVRPRDQLLTEIFSSYNGSGRSISGDQHSTEARNKQVQLVINDSSPEVNFTSTIEEIIPNESYDFLLYGTSIDNNSLNSDDEAEDEESEPEEPISYEEAPTSEFTNIEGLNSATIYVSISCKQAAAVDDGELYAGKRFVTKEYL